MTDSIHSGHPQVRILHDAYQLCTGLVLPLDMHRESVWCDFIRRGLTRQDLKLVITHIRRGIRDGSRNRGALRFNNLIARLDSFEEDLAEARAQSRARSADPNRAAVLRASGRPSSPADATRQAGQLAAKITSDPVAAAKAYEDFKKFKQSL